MQKQLRVPQNPATFRAAGIDLDDITLAKQERRKAAYERFCADLRRNLPPVEAECNGMPTLAEYLLATEENPHG